jgi:hypothetical protein
MYRVSHQKKLNCIIALNSVFSLLCIVSFNVVAIGDEWNESTAFLFTADLTKNNVEVLTDGYSILSGLGLVRLKFIGLGL